MDTQNLTAYLIQQAPIILDKTLQQIYLAGSATGIALLIGLPLGILMARYSKLKSPILAITNIFQTIPSLALLAFLIPFFGIGFTPAIIALTLYAILPIVRNTYTGITTLPPALLESADGLGFTAWQRLIKIELPLAMPIIIAGVRTATAMSVGIATLAAFIGAGGLGDFINQGLALNNTRLILTGAIPAALLALLLDYIIAQCEKHALKKPGKQKQRRRFFIGLSGLCIILLVFFCTQALFDRNNKETVVVASKNFTEQLILAEMFAQLIEEKTNLQVERKLNLGATSICQAAMLAGEIDIYPEYTGTGFLIILKQKNTQGLSADTVYQQVKRYYQQQFNIIWLKPLGFNNSEALAVRQDFAEQKNLRSISDLIPIESGLIAGVPPEFLSRPDGMPGLKKVYGLQFGEIKQMDPGLMYRAIKNKHVNVTSAFTTDGRILAYDLQVLIDDKHLFPPYFVAPLIRGETLKKHPELADVLNLLAGKINQKTMQAMNAAVDQNKKSPANVARNFLIKANLILA